MRWSLLLAIAACSGNGVRHIVDAPPISDDAAPGVDAAPPAPVTLHVTLDGSGQAGVPAIFTNADGSPVATLMTDATGTASQRMAAGGYVTAVDPFPLVAGFTSAATAAPSNLFTYAGVKPGDVLELSETTTPGAQTDFTLVVPAVTGAASYSASTLCHGTSGGGSLTGSGSTVTGSISMFGCTTADLFVAASDGTGQLLATLWHPALTVTASQTIDLSATDHYTAAVAETYSYANVPATSLQTAYFMITPNGGLVPDEHFTAVSSGSASFTLQQPMLGSAQAVVMTDFATPGNGHDVYDWSTQTGDYTLDLAAGVLPDVTSTPVFDGSADTLAWTAGSGATPDLVRASIAFPSDANVATWSIVAPYTTTLQFPPLAGYMPAATSAMQLDALQTGQFPGGYDAVRAFAFSSLDPSELVTLGSAARAQIQNYFGQQAAVARPRVLGHRARR
jgi:hypothetical protein